MKHSTQYAVAVIQGTAASVQRGTGHRFHWIFRDSGSYHVKRMRQKYEITKSWSVTKWIFISARFLYLQYIEGNYKEMLWRTEFWSFRVVQKLC